MRNIIAPVALALLALPIGGCAARTETTATPAAMPDSSRTSVDWDGSYRGVVPCADCEGIETSITLGRDSSYVLRTRYLGTDDPGSERRGTFSWDSTGGTIALAGIEDAPARYLVGENVLVQLDADGKRITGALADRYRLAKFVPPALAGTRWRLTELEGKPVTLQEGAQAPFLLLDESTGRVQGFGGCNAFTGGFEAPGHQQLVFSKVASTLRACPDVQTEGAFLRALSEVDNYAILDTTLSLAKARMAPLLRFEAAPPAP